MGTLAAAEGSRTRTEKPQAETQQRMLCDTSFNGIGYALQVEMLDEVTRAAWQDAEELTKAAAKRPGRQKAAK